MKRGAAFMAKKKTKRIIVLGAGFSAPAKLPIQSGIIDQMIQEPENDSRLSFLSGSLPHESIKFLNSYILVCLYLLDNYGQKNHLELSDSYRELCEQKNALTILSRIVDNASLNKETSSDIFNMFRSINELNISSDDIANQYYAMLNKIRSDVRLAIKEEGITVSLEDVFTSFDKSMITKEFLHRYTYTQMDEIRLAITSLFVFYFSKCVIDHDYNHKDYKVFFKSIQKSRTNEPTTIITTNWDTLVEEYCHRLGIKYNYGFYYPYTSDNSVFSNSKLNILKIHGSINWLKCHHCGGISVFDGSEAASSLFEDDSIRQCAICGNQEIMASPTLQPEIITPTMLKAFSSQVYSNLWSAATRELQKATQIVFIGYSLPIADFDFRYLLQKNIPCDAVINVLLAPNDNPDLEKNQPIKHLLPEQRYREAFPKNEIHFHYDGFGAYYYNNYSTE